MQFSYSTNYRTFKQGKRTSAIRCGDLRRLSVPCWWVVGIGVVFILARFSEAFFVLRAQQGGAPVALVPLVMVVMNLIYAMSASPLGKLSDRVNHTKLLALGFIVLICG